MRIWSYIKCEIFKWQKMQKSQPRNHGNCNVKCKDQPPDKNLIQTSSSKEWTKKNEIHWILPKGALGRMDSLGSLRTPPPDIPVQSCIFSEFGKTCFLVFRKIQDILGYLILLRYFWYIYFDWGICEHTSLAPPLPKSCPHTSKSPGNSKPGGGNPSRLDG